MGQAKTPSIPEKRPVRAQIKVLTRADKQISAMKFAYQWPATHTWYKIYPFRILLLCSAMAA